MNESQQAENQPVPAREPSGLWKKGTSGNISGKRKGAVSFTAALKRITSRKDAECVARVMLDVAKSGDVAAAKMLWDRMDGKVTDGALVQILHTGRESGVQVYLPQKEDSQAIDVSAAERVGDGT